MNNEDIDTDQAGSRWFIELDWFQPNNRSFFTLARTCLCPKCRKQLKVEEGEISAADLLSNIGDCCCDAPDFISVELPIMESIFRLFLANGNQPLDLEELGHQLGARRGGDASRTSIEVLSRLLKSDQHYGLRQTGE